MPTAATLPAIAKAIDSLGGRFGLFERRMSQLERGQEILAKNVHSLSTKVGKLDSKVDTIGKTLERVLGYAVTTQLKLEDMATTLDVVDERVLWIYKHLDTIVVVSERNKHEVHALAKSQNRLEARVARLERQSLGQS